MILIPITLANNCVQATMNRLHCTLLCLLLLCGCVSRSPHTAEAQPQKLGPGDCLLLAFKGKGEIRLVVDSAGDISLPLLAKLQVAGISMQEAQMQIQKQYDATESFLPIDVAVARCP